MSRTPSARRLVLALFSALIVAAVAVPTASAAVRIDGGAANFSLNAAFSAKLNTKGVTVTTISPATGLAISPAFPVVAGLINPASGVGSYKTRGGLRFAHGSKSVTISNLTIQPGGGVSGSLGGAGYTIFSASRGTVKRNGFNTDVAGIGLTLTPAAATALNKALALKKKKKLAFFGNKTFGVVTINSTSKQLQIKGGETRLVLNAGPTSRLASVGVGIKPIKPAKVDGDNVIAFPVTTGLLAASNLKGNFQHSGGLQFKKGNRVLKITAFQIKIAGSYTVKARHGKKNIVLATLDTSAMTKELNPITRHIVLRGIKAELAPAAARLLNLTFSTKQFLRGDELGQVAVDVKAL